MASNLWKLPLAGAFVLVATAGFGCGDFVESGDGVQRLTVGAEGGTLTIGELALVVPPHALDHTVTLTAQRATPDAPAGAAFTVDSTDHPTSFATAADVTLHYDASVHTHAVDVYVGILTSNV